MANTTRSDRGTRLRNAWIASLLVLCLLTLAAGGTAIAWVLKSGRDVPRGQSVGPEPSEPKDLAELAADPSILRRTIERAESRSVEMSAPRRPLGKVGPINVTDPSTPLPDLRILAKLPSAMRPHSVDDVQTFALLHYGTKEFPAYYASGASGFAKTCVITLVDRSSREVIARGDVSGTPPKDASAAPGELDQRDIVAFIVRAGSATP